ncbi:hypothetical protein MZV22_23295 [Escherichia coli]|uniref:hypothetical protein n=6 Tax=Escherichia coli TaxID=562 RepID=UPI003457FE86
MKQMSLIEMDGFLKGKCIPSDLKVNETNADYLVRKFAEAEAKCAALAAENELARKAVQAFCDVVGDNTEVIAEVVGRDGVLVILEAMKATGNMPATDAFLAEVRAQGVELLREHPAIQICSLTHVCDEFLGLLGKHDRPTKLGLTFAFHHYYRPCVREALISHNSLEVWAKLGAQESAK